MLQKTYNPNCSKLPDHSYKILKFGGSWFGKTNALFNLMRQQSDIDKNYLCAKDPYEAIYQFLINRQESTCLKKYKNFQAFIDYLNDMDNIFKNIQEQI